MTQALRSANRDHGVRVEVLTEWKAWVRVLGWKAVLAAEFPYGSGQLTSLSLRLLQNGAGEGSDSAGDASGRNSEECAQQAVKITSSPPASLLGVMSIPHFAEEETG